VGKQHQDSVSSRSTCLACKIGSIRCTRRGSRLLTSATHPGQELHLDVVYNKAPKGLHLDVVYNKAPKGLTIKDHHRYYLGVTDAFSRAYFLIGMMDASVNSLKFALRYAEYYKPTASYSLHDLEVVHADVGTFFDSAPFKEWCKQEGRKASVILAAPRRPQQNGLTENRWQQVQKAASNMLAQDWMSVSKTKPSFMQRSSLTYIL
jgi:transposase InsO family protein